MEFFDDRIKQIVLAYNHALLSGWLPDHLFDQARLSQLIYQIDTETDDQGMTAAEEWFLWKQLLKYRSKLAKVNIKIPSANEFADRFWIEPIAATEYQTANLSKNTVYAQNFQQGRWVCDCKGFQRYGHCKHVDAVNAQTNTKLEAVEAPPEPIVEKTKVVTSTVDVTTSVIDYDVDWSKYTVLKLNSDQIEALNQMLVWFEDDHNAYFRLLGPAGTGKSTVITVFMKYLLASGRITSKNHILMCSAFNKAVKVLREKLWENNLEDIATGTLCQALALREKKNADRIVFSKIPGEGAPMENYKLVVIDEVSTIATEVWDFVQETQQLGYLNLGLLQESGEYSSNTMRVILMGDPYQLPPINEAESQAFLTPVKEHQLNEVMRHGGAILNYVTTIRENIDKAPVTPITQVDDDKNGLWIVDSKAWFSTMTKGFQSESYAANAQHCRTIAWTNKRVNYLNQKIRNFLGFGTKRWVEEERIVAMAPFFTDGKGQCLLTTSQEAQILSISEGILGAYAVYWFMLKTDELNRVSIPVIHETDEAKFMAELKDLANEKKWAKYWALKETYADVNYSYCITAHKAQGSTFQNVWVDLPNFCQNQRTNRAKIGKVREAAQLTYVGASRASKRLFVLK